MNQATVLQRTTTDRVGRAGLQVDWRLAAFIEDEALAGTGILPAHFWQGLAELLAKFTPRNRALLETRERMQAAIDQWHRDNPGSGTGAPAAFLKEIGYLGEGPAAFEIGTAGVDNEISAIAGPQLVVPVLNERFALNAVNARWGSLYDALYGTDALGEQPPATSGYDQDRGARVIAWAKAFLDTAVPLSGVEWSAWDGQGDPPLADASQLVGRFDKGFLLSNNGLHIELVIDRAHPVGRADPAGIADVVLEAALTTIVDLEDSVAAVDAEDKVAAYRNWLGLMRGDLTARFVKGGKTVNRVMAPDRYYRTPDGSEMTLPGRSLLLVRNVGHLMTNPAVLMPDGEEAFEGLLDAVITSLAGLHDVQRLGQLVNSRAGAIYIVKPKMHGPAECALTNDVFDAVEDMFGLARHTIKVGVMDEERRTSANLAACIHAVKERVFFINTGFLDRTGDEIHTSMLAGAMQRKGAIKTARWIEAYEARNVQIGLQCGFAGRAQIGKGMWAAPDRMQAMLTEKIGHPMSGASTAWVPSPTAAVLHATHYHRCDVAARQAARADEPVTPLAQLLEVPLAAQRDWSPDQLREELDTNVQGILGYVVRWIDQGVGCSKVPDIHDIGLMEDRATLRISSQLLANWLLHKVVGREDIEASFACIGAVVDRQNAGDSSYMPLIDGNDVSPAFRAALSLVLEGTAQPSGYTEPLLHAARQQAKADGAR